MRNTIRLILTIVIVSILASCGNTRQFQYLQGNFDTTKLGALTLPDPIIQKGDMLGIVVFSDNPAATTIYNQPVLTVNSTTGYPNATSTPAQGYLVDSEGDIQFQSLGSYHVAGMSRKQLNDSLLQHLKVYLTNPYTSIRFLNYKVTVIGDVNRPGVYNIPGERVNVLEAIGLAGELTIYGRKDNILVVREINGKREFGRLDLRNPELFISPYYYLQQNDVVVIDQVKNKQSANEQVTVRNISLGASIISTIAILISVLRR